MELEKLPVYLSDLKIKAAKKGEPAKILVASLVIQPFTVEISESLELDVKTKLFTRDGNPAESVNDIGLSKLFKYYFAAQIFRTDQQVRASVKLDTVKLLPAVNVRRDKETPIYVATIKIQFDFPSEPKDLVWLCGAVNTSLWVTLVEEQGRLIEEPEGGSDEEKPAK